MPNTVSKKPTIDSRFSARSTPSTTPANVPARPTILPCVMKMRRMLEHVAGIRYLVDSPLRCACSYHKLEDDSRHAQIHVVEYQNLYEYKQDETDDISKNDVIHLLFHFRGSAVHQASYYE